MNGDVAMGMFFAMEEAIRAHPHDGLVYEDCYVRVVRENGTIVMIGQPLRSPFMYTTAESC